MPGKIATVFGGGRVDTASELYSDGMLLGRLLAEAGYDVATGGYKGTMEAVMRGAATAGGHTVGYTCSIFDRNFRPNAWVVEERKTDTLNQRIERMARESDAFVVLHGGLGTLAELALVWNLTLVNPGDGKPIVVIGPEWQRVVQTLYAETQLGSSALALLTLVNTPQQALAALQGR